MENLDQEYTPHSIRTFTGKCFDITILDPDSIDILDIAHALSHSARFAGHTCKFLSVAEHSVRAASLVPDEHKLAALLHDASEAYLTDIPKPFKELLPDYKKLEDQVMIAIASKFGFDYPLHPSIKKADAQLLQEEWDNHVMKGIYGREAWPSRFAKITFLTMYQKLTANS